MEFTVVQGDIASESADALVNAAGTSLRMGSGVAGFEFETGAELVCEEIAAYDPESLSEARVIAYSDSEYRTLEAVANRVW